MWEAAYLDQCWVELHDWNLQNAPNLQGSSNPAELLDLISSYVTACAWEGNTPGNLDYIKKQGSTIAGKDEQAFTQVLEAAAAAGVQLRSFLQLSIPIGMRAAGHAAKAVASFQETLPFLGRCCQRPIITPPYNIPQFVNPQASVLKVTCEQAAIAAKMSTCLCQPSILHPQALARSYLPVEQRPGFDQGCLGISSLASASVSTARSAAAEYVLLIGSALGSTPLQITDACSNSMCLHMYGPSTTLKVGKETGTTLLRRVCLN